jgi:dynein heavy chain, axonemal
MVDKEDLNKESPLHRDNQEKNRMIEWIDSTFLFACIWSICITVVGDNRKDFSEYLKGIYEGRHQNLEKFAGGKKMPAVFDRGMIYDYVYFGETMTWKQWYELVNKDEVDNFPRGTQVQNMVITTIDTIRYSHMQEYCINHKIPTLFCGPTGTGKSVYIQSVLLTRMPKENFENYFIGFSA